MPAVACPTLKISSYFSRSVIATWLAALSFIAILVGGWLHEKDAAEARMRDNVVVLSQVAADRLSITFDSISKAMQIIGDMVGTMNIDTKRGMTSENALALQTMLIRTRGANPSLVSLSVTDATGRPLAMVPFHSSRVIDPARRQDISPPPAFESPQPSISAPFKVNGANDWHVRMTHRIEGSGGTAVGLVIADIALQDALAHFFGNYPLAEGDFVALHDSTHQRVAAFPDTAAANAFPPMDRDTPSPLIEGLPYSVHTLDSPTQQTTHLLATHRLSQYPFHVVYGENISSWLITIRQERLLLAIAILAAIVVTAATTAGIQRRLLISGQMTRLRDDLEVSNTALRAALDCAEKLAAHDQLTGLFNRRSFDEQLAAAIARSDRHGDPFSLLMIDIDHFKQINDHYGHSTGDLVLKTLAQVLKDRLRQNDLAARWGGEEFAVLADGTAVDAARTLAENIREAIATASFAPVPRVTVSAGVAEHLSGESGDDVLRRADRALYSAKRNGRNRVISAENPDSYQRQTA